MSDLELSDEWDAPIMDDRLDADAAARQGEIALESIVKVREGDQEEKELAGDTVLIAFELPNGTRTEEQRFFMGQAVEVLKFYLEEAYQLDYETTKLYLGDLHLMDPLSLCDLPFVAKQSHTVKVLLVESEEGSA